MLTESRGLGNGGKVSIVGRRWDSSRGIGVLRERRIVVLSSGERERERERERAESILLSGMG